MMVESIEIIIQNGLRELTHALVTYQDKICYMNNNKYIVNDDFLDGLVRTIRLWKNEYGSSKIVDSEEFTIIVRTKEGEESFHGKGIFPSNYNSLKELLGGIHD